MSGGESDIGRQLNGAIAYLSESTALRLARAQIQGQYGKLVISLLTPPTGYRHGLVTLLAPICEVFLDCDPTPLLGPEPTRRSAATKLVKEAIGLVGQKAPEGAAEVLTLCLDAWATAPPYQFEITRAPIKHGRARCRVFYVFGPATAAIEVEIDEPPEPPRTVSVRRASGFVSLDIWFPVRRTRSVQDGLVFEDRFGRSIETVLIPRS